MGLKREPHRSGALWLPELRTAIVADLHLGYSWAQRRRGELGPLIDGTAVERLRWALEDLLPERVVLLGDVYHAPRPSPEERRMVEEALSMIRCELVLVRGNHDRKMERDFHKGVVAEWRASGVVAVHGDTIPQTSSHLIVGHFHPTVKIRDAAGVSRRFPAFVLGTRVTLLPAVSEFSVGMAWREVPLDTGRSPRVFALTRTRVAQIAGRRPSATQEPQI